MRKRDRTKLTRALEFALEAHGDQKRKGTKIPYVSHLLQVAGLVLEHGGDAVQATAALLHDTVEDVAHVDVALVRKRFGREVAEMVKALSDVLEGDTPEKKSPWLVRKRRYIAHLAKTGRRARLVSACDKLHNLRSILADLEHATKRDGRKGVAKALEKFSGSPRQIRWYYEEVIAALTRGLPPRLAAELEQGLRELRTYVRESSAKR